MNPKTTKIIQKMNIGNSTFIRTKNKLSNNIPVSTGIRQGDSLSPILFIVLMDHITKEVKTVERVYTIMGKTEFNIICYADDGVIISEDEDNLQKLLYRF